MIIRGRRREGGECKIGERCEKRRNTCIFYFKLGRNCSWVCRQVSSLIQGRPLASEPSSLCPSVLVCETE